MKNNAHELNLDCAYREIASREAQGEDMSQAYVNQKTYAIEFRKPDPQADTPTNQA